MEPQGQQVSILILTRKRLDLKYINSYLEIILDQRPADRRQTHNVECRVRARRLNFWE